MTLKEFEKVLIENNELYEKLKKAKKEFKFEEGKENEGLSKIISSLGYDVPASEFALEKIGKKEIDEEELKAVAGGGKRRWHQWGSKKYAYKHKYENEDECVNNYQDTDCDEWDFCDRYSIIYPGDDRCNADFRDTDCWFTDSCDYGVTKY